LTLAGKYDAQLLQDLLTLNSECVPQEQEQVTEMLYQDDM